MWKDIDGYNGIYQVSNLGRVKSISFRNNKTIKSREKILKTKTNSKKRVYIMLYKNGKRRNLTVHRLVASAFLPNPNSLPEVNHIDGNPTNNNINNLEWCTKSHNAKHAYENELNNLKEYNKSRKKPIIRNDGIKYNSAYDCAKALGVSVCSVRDVLKGRIKTVKGYSFSYL